MSQSAMTYHPSGMDPTGNTGSYRGIVFATASEKQRTPNCASSFANNMKSHRVHRKIRAMVAFR